MKLSSMAKAAPKSTDKTPDVHSVEAREPARSEIASDVEKFLDGGGEIEEVPRNFRADPPRRHENNYGRGSI